jgi:hypothetical protein
MPALPDEAAPSPKVVPSALTTPIESPHGPPSPTDKLDPAAAVAPGCAPTMPRYKQHMAESIAPGVPHPLAASAWVSPSSPPLAPAMASTARSEMSEEQIGIGLHGHNSSSRRTLGLRSLGNRKHLSGQGRLRNARFKIMALEWADPRWQWWFFNCGVWDGTFSKSNVPLLQSQISPFYHLGPF